MHLSRAGLAVVLSLLVVHAVAVRFEYESKSPIPAGSVNVAGSFNGWSTSSHPLMRDGVRFWADVTLSDGQYSYKFYIIDEVGNTYWMTDRANPAYWPDSEGNVNSYLRVVANARMLEYDGLEFFDIPAPRATDVHLAGDFNNWVQGNTSLRRTENGMWQCWLKVQRPVTYRFIVDDIWMSEMPRE